jgi:hypothetical protein
VKVITSFTLRLYSIQSDTAKCLRLCQRSSISRPRPNGLKRRLRTVVCARPLFPLRNRDLDRVMLREIIVPAQEFVVCGVTVVGDESSPSTADTRTPKNEADMSVEALWTMEFGSGEGWENGGVVVFETGRAFGGDSRYYYLGEFRTSGDRIEATLHIVHYHAEPRTPFGDTATDYTIELKGMRSNDRIEGNILREGYAPMDARLRRRSDLPTGVA